MFLMHRVELKVSFRRFGVFHREVPNAPCGVESYVVQCMVNYIVEFLMHRVELKVVKGLSI